MSGSACEMFDSTYHVTETSGDGCTSHTSPYSDLESQVCSQGQLLFTGETLCIIQYITMLEHLAHEDFRLHVHNVLLLAHLLQLILEAFPHG
jgi:hypothetical protein